jgi:hypothetical protein
LKKDGLPKKDRVPPNMHITVINALVPGVQNISTLENYENLSENVSEKIHDIYLV